MQNWSWVSNTAATHLTLLFFFILVVDLKILLCILRARFRNILSLAVYIVKQSFEGFVHVQFCHAWRLNPFHVVVLVANQLSFFGHYLSTRRVLLHDVWLVANEHYTKILFRLIQKWFKPKLHVFKRFAVCYVINDQCAKCFAIMSYGNGTVLLCASCVPQLGLYRGSIFHCCIFSGKFNSDCRANCLGNLIS